MAYAFNDDKSKFDLDTLAGNMATIEVSPTVSNHGIGEYILYDDVLYEVISPIAAGESLVLGTNVRSINIGDQLKTIQDFLDRKTYNMASFGNNVGNADTRTFIIEKCANVVHVGITIMRLNNSTIPINSVLCTLPSECYPANNYYLVPRQGAAGVASLGISSLGEIYLRDNAWSTGMITIDTTYMTT